MLQVLVFMKLLLHSGNIYTMIKILIAAVSGITVAILVSYFLFHETFVVPGIIGVISFMAAYTTLKKKKG